MNRCILNNPCGEHGKCVAGASFNHTCDCDAGYKTKKGVCVKDEDDCQDGRIVRWGFGYV